MIEYLEQLIDSKEFEKALAFAEQLLLAGTSNPKQLVAIQSAIVDSRLQLKDYGGAIVAGEIAVRLAMENREWDCFGVTCMNMGVAYYYLRDWGQAINAWTAFLTALTWYHKCSAFEATVRYNLGLAQNAVGDFKQACHSMEQAISAAKRFGNEDFAHGIRLALVGALLKAGTLNPIPRLLAQCGRYIRTHRDNIEVHDSGLWHISLRVEYTFTTGRLDKARRLALRAVFNPDARSDHQFSFHMLLARMAHRRRCEVEALGHALAARIHAEQCHRHDLLVEADDLASEVAGGRLSLMRTLDQYLLASVLPLRGESDVPV
jgi:tetratricopeptide (TPR) repeat protein